VIFLPQKSISNFVSAAADKENISTPIPWQAQGFSKNENPAYPVVDIFDCEVFWRFPDSVYPQFLMFCRKYSWDNFCIEKFEIGKMCVSV